jgi:hypothetical protein
MDDDAVDLRFEAATPVPARDFAIRVDGVEPEEAKAIERRVGKILERQWAPEATVAPNYVSPAPRDPAERGPIHVGLVGPSIDPARQRELEDAIRAAVAEELGGHRERGNPDGGSCTCVMSGLGTPGDRIGLTFPSTPGTVPWFASGGWTPPPSGASFWTIAVLLDSAPFNVARLILRDGATFNPPVPSNQALVGLANATDWAKEIWAGNLCSGRIGSVFQSGRNSTPRRMLLTRSFCAEGTDTIVFRKPGFFGFWHEVGHFPPGSGPGAFWRAFGGTWGDYTWTVD